MESLHNDGLAGGVIGKGSRSGGGRRVNLGGNFLRLLACWLLCGITIWFGVAQAQTTYVHDANGRVVAVTQSNGTSVQYGYDTLGHAGPVSAPLSAGQFAIFAFTPVHGEATTQVIIQGHGFDSNAANDTVSFNGTVATALSATTTQLVTAVPSGATTGPISVTADGQTATSATSFVIDDTGLPPSIIQVSPTIVSVGNTVTIAGTNLDPLAGNTTVQMAGLDMSLTSVSDTQLRYTVPSNGGSGFVTAETPYGTASSPAPVIVLPSGDSASNVVSTGNAIVNGTSVNLTIGASGQTGALTFMATQGGWVSLQASAITTTASSITYTVYGPGNVVVQQGTISAASPSIHLPHLTAGAIYLALFTPSGAGAQLTIGAQTDATLTIGSQTSVVTTVAGQSERLLFNASAGQNLAFEITHTSTDPSGQAVGYTIYSPSGAVYTSTSTSSTGTINFGNLPIGGIYQVLVAPGGGVTGNVQLEVAPADGGALDPNAGAQSYSTSVANQNVYLSFTATQGENLELALNNLSNPGASGNGVMVDVYNASGTEVASSSFYPTYPDGSSILHLWDLAAGTYSAVVVPSNGGTLSFNALLTQDIIGPTIATGGTANFSLSAGQVERFTFNANAGDTVVLNASGIASTPSGQGVNFYVYRPDVGVITASTPSYALLSTGSSQTVNLPNLPVSGTYTVIAVPWYGLAASGRISLVSGVTGTVPASGATQSYSTSVASQNVYLSFTATQGENLELALNNLSNPGASGNGVMVDVYNASGTEVASSSFYPTYPDGSSILHLWDLAAGTYSAVVVPSNGGTLSFNALLTQDIIGPTIATGGTANFSLSAGQVERFTFNANAGDTVVLNASGIVSTPSGQGVNFYVYRPDVGVITASTPSYALLSTGSSQTVNLPNLPVSGTYTVIAVPWYGLAASGRISLVSGVTGTVPASGATQSYSTSVASQNVYLSFTATQGENLELALNNLSNPGASGNGVMVDVYNASGTEVASSSFYPTYPDGSSILHLWDLAAGTYSAVVVPSNGGTLSFNALLTQDIIGPTIATGGTANFSLSAGQVERFTFNANAGDTVVLNASGIVSTPSGQGVNFYVYRPDVGVITASTPSYALLSTGSSQTVNLPNLPVSGTYTVIAVPWYGLAATGQLSVVSDVSG